MKEIIESILEEEKQARERVEKARNEALVLQREAEESARRLEEQSLKASREEAAKLVSRAVKEAQEERERLLQSETKPKKSAVPDELVDRLFRFLTGEPEK